MSLEKVIEKYKNGEISVEENISNVLNKIKENELNAYITINEEAIEDAKKLDEKLKENKPLGKLFGIAVAIKDNISTKNLKTTCASKMLEDFKPVFDATVIENLKKEDAIIIGKTNMDEFAMGGSSETSYFGAVKNPLDKTLVPGGSSSGSAATVSNGDVLIALGSDTGGSVREPASYCNVVGYYPTYSLVSRRGVVSMANSLDQVGVVAKNVDDVVDVIDVISSPDEKDMTSIKEKYDFSKENYDFSGKKIAIFKDLKQFGTEDSVIEDFNKAIEIVKNKGAIVEEIESEYIKYANMVYNIVMSSEVSSNMSRFDGIRYGFHPTDYKDAEDLFLKTRSRGFGEEVQRRIATGTMYLSASDGQKIYKQGLKVRTLLKREINEILKKYDFIFTPTTTDLPYKLGEKIDNPLSSYDSGIFNVIVNLSSTCAISVPIRKGLSGSLQIIGASFDDKNLLNAARAFEGGRDEN
ncbi:MAG: Asp-tRNA(Asn)/Glu-tRNA(Gln) amidotransferase subunit GatA [Peptoniphilaceae bacterium]|nr:Asp-tRNA(Asn)/Glu-tRNA(Gln) amidotransferase subunit GatA [Peptoniphilaceae bacterium]MDD7383860.1 Asp-tRNA(Asn)/Glu-tRNA(Gln) amidotransferase subunit GatA [Peptoniphilaceae bacterium]MDY3738001.1 Asp-tRNA(Asn)/Glu-tRNA(Gln) amidotransferase subunit GatA [Peptoniphilaceae bacterium]